jgi:hypothetical protein
MMEWWVFKRMLSILNFIVETNFDIYPILQFPKIHFPNIPKFQHSNLGVGGEHEC